MQIKLKGDPGDGGKKPKVRVKTPSPTEIQAANQLAKDIAARRGLLNAENMHVGNQVPKFYDDKTGKELLAGDVRPPVGVLSNKVPLYVKSLQWDDQSNLPYYIDDKTGDMQYVAKDLFYSPRFRSNNQSLLSSVAKR
jgi:hypothetical protein